MTNTCVTCAHCYDAVCDEMAYQNLKDRDVSADDARNFLCQHPDMDRCPVTGLFQPCEKLRTAGLDCGYWKQAPEPEDEGDVHHAAAARALYEDVSAAYPFPTRGKK